LADRSSNRRRRRGLPLGLLGAAVLIALLGAYLSDCIPGLGSGGGLGTPEPPASAPSKSPAEPGAAADRIAITVQGDQCRRGDAELEPCARVCASLDRTRAATVAIDLEATEGRHGTVEELRTCLREAGFARVRIISE
jgi:hypothetical protein